MIYRSGYNTTVGSVFVTKHIESAIQEAIIRDYINNVTLDVSTDGEYKPIFILGYQASENNIPLFSHPITINTSANKKYLCTDLRLFINKPVDIFAIEKSIKNRTEYNFTKARTILNLIWLNEGIGQIKNGLQFAGIVFASWLSGTISKNYALDFKDQLIISIITSIYYQSLFIDDFNLSEDEKQRLTVHTIKATKAPAELILEILDKITTLSSINDYCSTISSLVENSRLKDFSFPILLNIIKNSWYGTNSKEIISVALEHPPTWCAIVYSALVEKTYKTSSIYHIAERFGKKGGSDEFIFTFASLVKDKLNVSKEELFIREFN